MIELLNEVSDVLSSRTHVIAAAADECMTEMIRLLVSVKTKTAEMNKI